MIRPFTCLCLLLAGGSGLYLYQEKHRTQMLDREIGRVIHETEATRERIGALKAEWAVRTEPGRLSDLATRFLALKPMAPTQFVQLADLAGHLPAVGPMPAAVIELPAMAAPSGRGAAVLPLAAAAPADGQAAVRAATATDDEDDAAAAPAANRDIEAGHPTAPPMADTAAAQDVGDADAAPAATAPAPHPKPAARTTTLAAAHPHRPAELQIARSIDAGRPTTALAHGGLLPLASSRLSGVRVEQAAARPGSGNRAAPLPRSLQPQSASFVGSSLGGAASLPPPVPYSGQ